LPVSTAIFYLPSTFQVMKILLRSHGLNLTGVKSNLYTAIGVFDPIPDKPISLTYVDKALIASTQVVFRQLYAQPAT
jgi:hypothetical protein